MNTILWKDDGYTVEGDEVAEIGSCEGTESPEVPQPPSEVVNGQPCSDPRQGQSPKPISATCFNPDLIKHAAEAGIGVNNNPNNPNNQHLGYDGSLSTMPEPSNFFFDGSSDLFQPLLVSSDMFALDDISFMDEPIDMNTTYDPPSMLPVGIPYGARFPSHT